MVRRILLPILALAMLVPPGICACSHAHSASTDSRSESVAAPIVIPEPSPVRHHCRHHHREESVVDSPTSVPLSIPEPTERIPEHSHDPFCPSVTPLDLQPPSQDFGATSVLLSPMTIDIVPWVCTSAVRIHASDHCNPVLSLPIYISHCALLI